MKIRAGMKERGRERRKEEKAKERIDFYRLLGGHLQNLGKPFLL